jgi:response regulator RpfG family c-di-GMP phosphodiesterase
VAEMKKILIVDDNQQNLYMLGILLDSNHYQTIKAADGKEALELARVEMPDLIISDILMPTMDGFSFCRALKTDEKLAKIPFIFYTATYTDPNDEAFALSLGAERFVVKPVEPEEMLKILRETFEKREIGSKENGLISFDSEEDFYRSYSEALVRKLEDKMMQLERANKRLAALYQASCDLILIKVEPDLVNSLLHTIVETAGYEQADYFEYDSSQKKLSISASVGFSIETQTDYRDQLVFNFGDPKGLVGLVAKTGQNINISDTTKDPRWMALDKSILSALFIPVHFENTLLGVIGLFSKETNAFSKMDEENVSSLTNSLAVAIENKKNQEKVQKHLLRLSALHNIDLAINGSMDLRATLNIILSHVADQLQVDAADIILFNRFTMGFEYAAGRGFLTRIVDNHEVRQRSVLAEKVILQRKTISFEGISDPLLPSSFVTMWITEGFCEYWGVPLIAKGEVKGVLEVFKRAEYEPDAEWLDYLETLAGQAAIAIDNADMFDNLQKSNVDLKLAYDATIEGWSRALDLRDKETENHTLRVVEKTLELASLFGLSNEELVHIKFGALLHDIGKMGVPDGILHKPGPLTDEEWLIMRKHPDFAYEMLSPIPYLHRALDIPCCHHEKWDGTGYPRGMKGDKIPLAARLFAVVDVWDALGSDRPYRKAWKPEDVMEYIENQSGKFFDPDVVVAFMKMMKKDTA